MKRRVTCRRASGFTLVEVLVMLVVSGFIILLLAQGTRTGTADVAALDRSANESDRLVIVDGFLRALIDRAVPIASERSPGLIGSPHRLVMRTALSSRPNDVGIAAVDATLEVLHGSLVLVWRTYYPSTTFEPLPVHEESLVDGVTSVEFGYASTAAANGVGETGWVKAWDRPSLPALIRIRIHQSRRPATGPWPDIVVRSPPLDGRT